MNKLEEIVKILIEQHRADLVYLFLATIGRVSEATKEENAAELMVANNIAAEWAAQ